MHRDALSKFVPTSPPPATLRTPRPAPGASAARPLPPRRRAPLLLPAHNARSEEHTSELQSHHDLVCRLLLEKKKKKRQARHNTDNQPRVRKMRKHAFA